MTWLDKLIALVQAFLGAIPIVNRWVTKTPTEKVESKQEDAREDTEKFKETGRPSW